MIRPTGSLTVTGLHHQRFDAGRTDLDAAHSPLDAIWNISRSSTPFNEKIRELLECRRPRYHQYLLAGPNVSAGSPRGAQYVDRSRTPAVS
jgi:hypothetical protein